jgi:hypothetical protein
MEQSSNQILIDMQNIYKLKDIIELSSNHGEKYPENIDSNP